MDMPRRRNRVRFVVVPDGHPARVREMAGVTIPPYGVFVDTDGEVIPLVVDDADPFRVMTRGMLFSKEEAARALKGSTLHASTSNAERRLLFHEITYSGIARHAREPLRRALADFGRPTWGICGPIPHLHIYLRGRELVPERRPERGTVHSLLGGSLAAFSLMAEGLVSQEDVERLVDTLAHDPRFEDLPIQDPPPAALGGFILITIG